MNAQKGFTRRESGELKIHIYRINKMQEKKLNYSSIKTVPVWKNNQIIIVILPFLRFMQLILTVVSISDSVLP